MHHDLDIHLIPEKVLYINDLSIADPALGGAVVNNRIACFLTCGYTEAGAMQFFLRKVNDKFEYKQYLEDIKKYLLENSDNHTYAEKISASRNLYYSKKLHGDRMMRTIVPDILGARCRHFFRPTYLELRDFTMGES